MQLWDSAGQERYKALIPSYVRGASIIFILYDISNRNSFNNVIMWINFIKQLNNDESFLVLCGNKIDLNRQVSTKEGKSLAEKEKMLFFETSAQSGTGVNDMMYSCIARLPFFEQFKIENKNILIQELMKGNNSNNEDKVSHGNMNTPNTEDSSNIILTKKIVKDKKKCGC